MSIYKASEYGKNAKTNTEVTVPKYRNLRPGEFCRHYLFPEELRLCVEDSTGRRVIVNPLSGRQQATETYATTQRYTPVRVDLVIRDE